MTKIIKFELFITALENAPENSMGCITITSDFRDMLIEFLKKNKPKPYESRKKKACICGCKSPTLWYICGGEYKNEIKCPKWGRHALGKSELDAIRIWNSLEE